MPIPELKIIPASSGIADKFVCHRPYRIDPIRAVDVTVETLELRSGWIFWGNHESKIKLIHLKNYLVNLNKYLQDIVDTYSTEHLEHTVGFHMRRTDSRASIHHSPDALFWKSARQIIAGGKKIFLATDNTNTESEMKRLFGNSIITYPKRQTLKNRWPREFDQIATEDDLIDLFLLAKTEYVIGSFSSSFSEMAIMLNGSARSVILKG
jgi:hypothetical protein